MPSQIAVIGAGEMGHGIAELAALSGFTVRITDVKQECPDRVVGMHFFNPAVLMPLIEVVKGDDTSAKTVREAEALARAFKKTSVVCRKDVPGFITSRTIAPYMLEAAWIHHEEGIPKEAIDSALRFKVGFPMGPFELADQVGIDLMVYATEKAGLAEQPPMKDLVAAGKFGRKSGEGFYAYVGGGRPTITPDLGKGFGPPRLPAPPIEAPAARGAD